MPAYITAVGAVTGHGLGADALVEAVLAGKTAVRPLTRFDPAGLCSEVAADAPSDDKLLAAARGLDVRPPPDRASRLLLAALAEALAGRDRAPSDRRAALVGTTKGALEPWLADWAQSHPASTDALGDVAAVLARACGARGPVRSVGAACASSSAALGEALQLIERQEADEVVVAGVEALHRFVFAGFHALKAMSILPAMPFDARRTGLSMGEGAGVLVLESPARAAKAGRAALATLKGYGSAADGYDQTAPDPQGAGLVTACRLALAQAGLEPSQVGRYHAHGTATPFNDRMEAACCRAVFGPRGVSVTGIKGSVGHTLGAAGALDVIVCARTLRQGTIPAIVNSSELEPGLEIDPVFGQARAQRLPTAVVATAGFGGINTALVLEAEP